MKRFLWLFVLVFAAVAVKPAAAENRIIVRNTLGASAMNLVCDLLGCNVERGLGDPNGQLFLITTPDLLDPVMTIAQLLSMPGVTGVEIDQPLTVEGTATAAAPPAALYDSTPMTYYGSTVRHGYVYQPANQIIRTLQTQQQFGVAGAGIVAVIDTGVDTTHPALQSVLVPGYDFVHNTNNPDEKADLQQSTEAVLDSNYGQTALVNQSTEAVLDQSTEAVLDGGPQYAAFGHGTMTSGVVHLVAPKAKIMPLKAFAADGSGYASDVLRAIYFGAGQGAKVINMSFSFAQSSAELKNAIGYASNHGVICIAAAGNDGLQTMVYPAGYSNVMGIASTDNYDVRSYFSNYGSSLVWVAAPGEGIVTTYPFGHYAAAWGTSFSTPFVSGTSALLVSVSPLVNGPIARSAISYAQILGDPGLHYRRLDTYRAVSSWWWAVARCGSFCYGSAVNTNYVTNTVNNLSLLP